MDSWGTISCSHYNFCQRNEVSEFQCFTQSLKNNSYLCNFDLFFFFSVLHLAQPCPLFPAYVWPWQLEDKASSTGQKFRNHNDRITLKLCHFLFSDKTKSDMTLHMLYTKAHTHTYGHFLVKWFISILCHFHFYSPST